VAGFPVDSLLPAVRQSLSQSSRLVLQAEPGAGKTTRVPLALLECDWLQGRKIIMLEPRRLAARSAARYMARSLGERVGATVGYRVRLDTRVGPQTRIEVVTEGVLTRLLQADPALESAGMVIFDEFHERSLQTDLGLALCLDTQAVLREDLRLLVMSATLDSAAISALLGDAEVLGCKGRSYPVTTHYRPLRNDFSRQRRGFCSEVASVTLGILGETCGSVLLFLPGVGEIRQVQSALQAAGLPADVQLAPLMGQLDAAAQDKAIQPAETGQRKLVLATAIAETSLTIEGISVVVDAGLMRISRFDPNTGLDRLVTQPVSRAAATQRCGRAGRLAAGECFRLWSEHSHLVPHSAPEILQADLAPLVLELAQWGVRETRQLHWLDEPPAAHLAQARDLLVRLGALTEDGAVTAHGRVLASLGVHPRLAHMMVRGHETGYALLACELAALLSERDPLRINDSDIQLRVEWLRVSDDTGGSKREQRQALRAMTDAWLKRLGAGRPPTDNTDLAQCGTLLAFAYPDRIARRRPGRANRFLLSNGRGARFREAEPLAASDFLVAAHLVGEQEAVIYLAASVSRDQLQEQHADLLREEAIISWDDNEGAVLTRRQLRLGELLLEDRPLQDAAAEAVRNVLLDGIQERGLDCLPWDGTTRQLQLRVDFLRALEPDKWPDFGDKALSARLQDWLLPFLGGMTRIAHLRRLDLQAVLLAQLSWEQQQQLNRLAPTHLRVPSGSKLQLDYSEGRPVLAVRLQEMFGLADTPRVAAGRVAVLLHLLSPARRPVQITQDLATFWSGSYHAVKKELKGRYPKHPWPDDPLQALPTARIKPRKR
jgi:ATP-dependent RNA helicase HrpB